MKRFLLFLCLGMLGTSFAQSEKDWQNLSKDYCKGFNKCIKGLSETTRDALVDSGETGASLEELFVNAMTNDPTGFQKDVEILVELPISLLELTSTLGKKYEGVFNGATVDEIDQQYLKRLKGMKGCEVSRAMIQIGIREEEKIDEEE